MTFRSLIHCLHDLKRLTYSFYNSTVGVPSTNAIGRSWLDPDLTKMLILPCMQKVLIRWLTFSIPSLWSISPPVLIQFFGEFWRVIASKATGGYRHLSSLIIIISWAGFNFRDKTLIVAKHTMLNTHTPRIGVLFIGTRGLRLKSDRFPNSVRAWTWKEIRH